MSQEKSIKEVSEQMQTTNNYISDIEAGRKFPATETLEKFANVYQVPYYKFFEIAEQVQEFIKKAQLKGKKLEDNEIFRKK